MNLLRQATTNLVVVVVGGDTSLFEIRAGGRMLIARCRDGEAAVYGDGRESKCAFGAKITLKLKLTSF